MRLFKFIQSGVREYLIAAPSEYLARAQFAQVAELVPGVDVTAFTVQEVSIRG
jgi:hypothetical protein